MMLAREIARRRMRGFFAAFEEKDLERLFSYWSPEALVEFPQGVPMRGAWRGEELRQLFAAVFAHNESITITPRHVAVRGGWSPRGRMTVVSEWTVVEKSVDGHVVQTDVVSVAHTDRWVVVRTMDFFSNVPGMAEHYASIPLPRRSPTAVPSTL